MPFLPFLGDFLRFHQHTWWLNGFLRFHQHTWWLNGFLRFHQHTWWLNGFWGFTSTLGDWMVFWGFASTLDDWMVLSKFRISCIMVVHSVSFILSVILCVLWSRKEGGVPSDIWCSKGSKVCNSDAIGQRCKGIGKMEKRPARRNLLYFKSLECKMS